MTTCMPSINISNKTFQEERTTLSNAYSGNEDLHDP